jgi:hypothetical protein
MITYKCDKCRTRECTINVSLNDAFLTSKLSCPARFDIYEWKLVEDNTDKVGYPIENKKELPDWVENGDYGYHEEYGYIRLSVIDDTESEAHIVNTNESINVDNEGFFNGRIVEAQYHPFTDDELKSMVGKIVTTADGDISLVTDYENGGVCICGGWFDSDHLAESRWEFEGKLCQVLKHRNSKGEWVK